MNRLPFKPASIAAFFFGLMIIASCNSKPEHADSKKEADKTQASASEEKVSAPAVNIDSIFVAEAIISNDAELKLIEEGLSKVSSAVLKKQMRMMKDDHKRMVQQLRAYARKMNFPDSATFKESTKVLLGELGKHKIGKAWDKAWMDLITAEHRKIIQKFVTDSGQLQDPPLKTLVEADIPVLQSHVDALYLLPASM